MGESETTNTSASVAGTESETMSARSDGAATSTETQAGDGRVEELGKRRKWWHAFDVPGDMWSLLV
ncbi:hypothetical protein CC2G_009711 [Coprinopsis cinerea AmutBmut pab1-1]|nr:hypothetical protein CC2G_009711 [Coprinopsis cinerea AmutBmut pab1-1]